MESRFNTWSRKLRHNCEVVSSSDKKGETGVVSAARRLQCLGEIPARHIGTDTREAFSTCVINCKLESALVYPHFVA